MIVKLSIMALSQKVLHMIFSPTKKERRENARKDGRRKKDNINKRKRWIDSTVFFYLLKFIFLLQAESIFKKVFRDVFRLLPKALIFKTFVPYEKVLKSC